MLGLRRLDGWATRGWTMFVPGAVGAAIRLVLLPWFPIQAPATSDEFSYLLGADTFSHWRLTNPTHPLWRFFETIHEISIPTYQSKYPPGQAFFLAIGEVVFHHPFFGCLLAYVVLSTVVVWMSRPWMPPGTAFLAGCWTAIAFGPGNPWLDSYWGGAVGSIGAALVVGAFGRIRNQQRFVAAWPMAAGIVLIWFTRPFEGFFFLLGVAVVLAADAMRHRVTATGFGAFAGILVGCGALTLAFQGYYDFRVTGKVTQLPYALHHQQYDSAPLLWFQSPRTPTVQANVWVQRVHEWELGAYWNRRNLIFGRWSAIKPLEHTAPEGGAKEWIKGFEAVVVLLAVLGYAIRFRRDPAIPALAFVVVAATVPLGLETSTFPHYMVAIFMTLIALVFRLLWRIGESQPARAALFAGVLFAGAGANNAFRVWRAVHNPYPFRANRARVAAELAARPGQQVVFVHYAPNHDPQEWVFNSADIDGQKVVWARDLGADTNRQLMTYYQGRTFWLLDADAPRPEPVIYAP